MKIELVVWDTEAWNRNISWMQNESKWQLLLSICLYFGGFSLHPFPLASPPFLLGEQQFLNSPIVVASSAPLLLSCIYYSFPDFLQKSSAALRFTEGSVFCKEWKKKHREDFAQIWQWKELPLTLLLSLTFFPTFMQIKISFFYLSISFSLCISASHCR